MKKKLNLITYLNQKTTRLGFLIEYDFIKIRKDGYLKISKKNQILISKKGIKLNKSGGIIKQV